MGDQKNQLAAIRAAHGSLKRKPGDRPFAEAWAEYKREETGHSPSTVGAESL